MDGQTIALILTSVISGASIILRTIAPLTKTKTDDKILAACIRVLRLISIDSKYTDEINRKVNK